jgi:hypothetical protein
MGKGYSMKIYKVKLDIEEIEIARDTGWGHGKSTQDMLINIKKEVAYLNELAEKAIKNSTKCIS